MDRNDSDLYARIKALVDEEHALNTTASGSTLSSTATPGATDITDVGVRRREIEAQLDQCWDLLRQREAKRESGGNPDEARARPLEQVENYAQ